MRLLNAQRKLYVLPIIIINSCRTVGSIALQWNASIGLVDGQTFYFASCFNLRRDLVLFQVVLGRPSFRVPIKGLLCGSSGFPESVSNPFPPSCLYPDCRWLLMRGFHTSPFEILSGHLTFPDLKGGINFITLLYQYLLTLFTFKCLVNIDWLHSVTCYIEFVCIVRRNLPWFKDWHGADKADHCHWVHIDNDSMPTCYIGLYRHILYQISSRCPGQCALYL